MEKFEHLLDDFGTHATAKTFALSQVRNMYPHLTKDKIILFDNEHKWICYSENGAGCSGYGGVWTPFGVNVVDVLPWVKSD
jgi:hypothetical protein